MPRPYGWIRGEGTIKAQRWGLEGLGAEAMGPPVPPELVGQQPDVQQQIADLWSMLPGATSTNTSTNTIGSWLQNNMLLVAVGLGAVLLLKRR